MYGNRINIGIYHHCSFFFWETLSRIGMVIAVLLPHCASICCGDGKQWTVKQQRQTDSQFKIPFEMATNPQTGFRIGITIKGHKDNRNFVYTQIGQQRYGIHKHRTRGFNQSCHSVWNWKTPCTPFFQPWTFQHVLQWKRWFYFIFFGLNFIFIGFRTDTMCSASLSRRPIESMNTELQLW